jgi:hypothetical protein
MNPRRLQLPPAAGVLYAVSAKLRSPAGCALGWKIPLLSVRLPFVAEAQDDDEWKSCPRLRGRGVNDGRGIAGRDADQIGVSTPWLPGHRRRSFDRRGRCRSKRGSDIGPGEIIALVGQRQSTRLRRRIGRAVTKIQRGRVRALAETNEGLTRDLCLRGAERDDLIPTGITTAPCRSGMPVGI